MKLLYFAWVRTNIGKAEEELVAPDHIQTVADLLDWLATLGPLSLVLGAGIACALGFFTRRNLIVLLMAIELMLLAVNMNFVAFSYYLGDMHGQVFVFFILTVAAAESAIGLAILVVLFRNLNTIDVEEMDSLKG